MKTGDTAATEIIETLNKIKICQENVHAHECK